MKKKLLYIFLTGLFPVILLAGDQGNTGFDFLRMEIGARPCAMGGAFVSVPGDLHGVRYNPASLCDIPTNTIALTYLNQFLDINSGYVAYNKYFENAGHFGINVFYTSYGKIQKTNIQGDELGTFSPADFVFSAVYARQIPFNFQAGAAVKYISSKIDEYTSSALAFDCGVIYPIPKQRIHVGLSIQNLGKSLDPFADIHEKLPLTYRLGVSHELAHLPLLINFNLIRYHNDESSDFLGIYWVLGGEFTITEHLFLRWGYHSRGNEERIGGGAGRFAGVSMGMGIHIKKYQIDYSFGSYGVLGSMNQFTIVITL